MSKAYVITGTVILFTAVACGVLRVDGVSLRNSVAQSRLSALTLSQPAIPGVPIVARWQAVVNDAEAVTLSFRDGYNEVPVGEGAYTDYQTTIKLPCEASLQRGVLVLRRAETRAVIASAAITLLPSGPECLLSR